MKFGTVSNTELTQKYVRVKLQNDISTSRHIYKQTSQIFNSPDIHSPESILLASHGIRSNIYLFIIHVLEF